MKLEMRFDKQVLRDTQRKLGDYHKKAPLALSRALNRAASNVTSNISKEVRKEYNIKAGDVKATLTKTKASAGNLSAVVSSKGNVIGLDKFKVSPKTVNPKRKKSIKVGVKKNGVKEILGAFVANIYGTKIFKRKTKSRLPIERLYGPSVPQMLKNQDVRNKIEQEGMVTFRNRLDHEIERILENGR
jgi:hypothetical protein